MKNQKREKSLLRQRGFTLIELMVAMAIGLVVTLAVTSVVTLGESHKRTTTATNDMNQSGNYAAYLVDRAVRSAGSGFAQAWNLGVFGCTLNAARSGTAILPRASAFPAPFADVPQALRVAPLLIQRPATGSDVLVVMGGNASSGDVGRLIVSGSATTLAMDNTIGLAHGDIGLVSRSDAIGNCALTQISSTDTSLKAAGNDSVDLGDRYGGTQVGTVLTGMTSGLGAYFTPLGRDGANNVQFQMLGVNTSRTLVGYDLLRTAGTGTDVDALQSLADGVLAMRALYGVDTDGDGIFNTWVAPGSTGYDIATVMATPETIRHIVAVRLSLVLRSTDYTKERKDADGNDQYVAPAELVLFSDLGTALQSKVTLSTEDRHFRHRVVDVTIPLRNLLMLP